ncbi:restriction endonuclease subunit S [Bifidobacterium rousetti]|uniref:restriction endonuclease subunit S n=1 Tax=Bifidobacterium rousetti TaxID=2045439 RepID=UPI00123B73D5|nr:restriction endonuclease subunit S [Bifidobacterium rousetti]KAA8817910.1 restriction endonuclease subunit S [Bifidobacterium rousetti]
MDMKKTRLGDVVTVINGKNQRLVENPAGKYPIYGSGGVMGYADSFICPPDTVVIGRKGNINKPIYVTEPFWNVDTAFGLVSDSSKLLPRYLYHFCRFFDFERLNSTVTIPSLTKRNLQQVEIPLVDISDQYHFVAILDVIEQQITFAKQMLAKTDELVQSRFIEMFGDPIQEIDRWPRRKMNDLYVVTSAKRIYAKDLQTSGVPFLKLGDLTSRIAGDESLCSGYVDSETFARLRANDQVPQADDILVTARGTMGLCYVVKPTDDFYFQDGMITWLKQRKDSPDPLFLVHLFAMPSFRNQLLGITSGTTVSYLSIKALSNTEIPVPPIELQRKFAAFVRQIESLKTDLNQQLDRLNTLYDSLTQRYFA